MMKAYGYDRTGKDPESPLELREVALGLTVDEMDKVIAFLQDARQKFSRERPVPGQAHAHFRDWCDDWTPTEADIVLVYEG